MRCVHHFELLIEKLLDSIALIVIAIAVHDVLNLLYCTLLLAHPVAGGFGISEARKTKTAGIEKRQCVTTGVFAY